MIKPIQTIVTKKETYSVQPILNKIAELFDVKPAEKLKLMNYQDGQGSLIEDMRYEDYYKLWLIGFNEETITIETEDPFISSVKETVSSSVPDENLYEMYDELFDLVIGKTGGRWTFDGYELIREEEKA